MFSLLILFLLSQLAILARYFVYEAFDPYVYASTFLFLVAAVVVYFVSKRNVKKEIEYVPTHISSWSFLHRQTVFTNEKPLYKGNVKRGSIQKKFLKKWHYLIADLFGSTFYLNVSIIIDDSCFEIVSADKKFISKESYWVIYKNGDKIGTAKTIYELKNVAKFKEMIKFEINGDTYYTTALTVSSHIRLLYQEKVIGEMKRNHIVSSVYVIDVNDETPERIIPFILHAFYFKNK